MGTVIGVRSEAGRRVKMALGLGLCLLALGCGLAGPADDGPPPSTARIVCDRQGTHVLTPRVEAQPDGVHFVIDNRLGIDSGYSAEFPEYDRGTGGDAPKGESEHVEPFPPGGVQIGCYESRGDLEPGEYAILWIVEGESGYKPAEELECLSDTAVGGEVYYAPTAEGGKGDPVELVRRSFSERIEADDVVEVAGYPKSMDRKTVRVVRDGRVVALIEFFRGKSGWLRDEYNACGGF